MALLAESEVQVNEPVVGIFDDTDRELFTRYRVGLTFNQWVMGGVPQKPELIESWLRQRIIGGDDELRVQLLKTLEDLQYDIPPNATHEQILEAIKEVAQQRNGNTFRRNADGLFLAAYQVKALLKECCAILFPGGQGAGTHKWGVTKKSPRSYLAERVFIDELTIPLGRMEPDGTHLQIGQVNGPRGPRSTLTYIDYCDRASIQFTVASLQDSITADQWRELLVTGQREGLGALRSMGYGTFKVTAFDKL